MKPRRMKSKAKQPAAKGTVREAVAAPTPPAKPVEVKVTAAKGRPMLVWVGKRPLKQVIAYPAQHIETYSVRDEVAGDWSDWPRGYPKGGLLFHGDNKEVLAHLLANGFRGKVNLIYIDPPFDSGADYVRKVSLRGAKGTAQLDGEFYALGEQIQYTDIWANDNYLQFMYERFMLLRQLLSAGGVIAVHSDWKKTHHIRALMDEAFGPEAFRNEILWYFYNKMHDDRKDILPRATNTLLIYANGEQSVFNRIEVPRETAVRQLRRVKVDGVLVNLKDEAGNLQYQERDTKTLDNVWPIPLIPPADVRQKTDYPTQKPEALLDLIARLYSNPGDLILDCFIGSGTTAAVAQRLGRRWIGCDINKGSIQTTAKRLQTIITEQSGSQMDTESSAPTQFAFTVWRVNDYDLQIQHNEAANLAVELLGVERTRSDGFFDGTLGKALVKIAPFTHPLTPLDLEEVKRELDARPDEDRGVTVVCLGIETTAQAWVEEWNALRRGAAAVNKIRVIELRTDPKYGKFIRHEPARARVKIERKQSTIRVEIQDFISPSIVERLRQQAGVLSPKIDDWRAMVDCVMIDPAYDGKVFKVALSDVPERKTDLVGGTYELPAAHGKTTVAVKIVDMLGEEVLVQREL
ncbi:MAG: site-specific DNA-methyltransferase [Gemmatimonadales bacterium]|nr:site-specific DNA-methyltransferase [Gemmatimonadales bacterium]